MGHVTSTRIADIEECQATLTEIMRNPSEKAMSRIKAAEILLKTHGAFETKINLQSDVPVVINGVDELEE